MVEIEPSLFGKALDWIVASLGGLIGVVWTFLKADINRAHQGNDKAMDEIKNLYKAAEADREKNRMTMDAATNRLYDTMRLNQIDIINAIAGLKKK